jgi:hypothetical protein
LPLASHEDRHVDLVDEGDRVQWVCDRGVVVRVGVDLGHQIGRFAVEHLVGLTRRIATLDLLVRPGLATGGSGGFRVGLPLLRPGDGEAGVEDATGIQRRRRGIDCREWRDRLEVGWIELRHEQLADRSVRDTHHPDLVVKDPRLVGDRLCDVVPVEGLERLEVVEGASGAAGPTHIYVDNGEAHEVGDDSDSVLGPGWIGVPVSRIFDQRGVRRKVVRAVREWSAGR